MSWDAVGAIAEILGAAGVILSFAYLAIQVRQNTRQLSLNARSMEAASADAWMQYGPAFRANLIHDPGVARLFREGLAGEPPLNEDNQVRFHFLMLDAFTSFQTAVSRRGVGLMDDDTWHFQTTVLGYFLTQPGFYRWRLLGRRILGPSCVEFVETRPEFDRQHPVD
ncbi:MAG: hypothetical protein ACE5FA_00885 [Dehalococcoidia bacterium]